MRGYYQHPTLHGQQLVFVCEDDLWWVELSGGLAQRLTAAPGRCRTPQFSPCGRYLAYTGRDEGHSEVTLLDLQGGEPQRLTFLGADTMVVGFSPDGQWIYYTSNEGQPFARLHALGRVSTGGGPAQRLPWGPAASISFEPGGPGRVLGRHTWDTARWKRYRGGTVGQFWVDCNGQDQWQPLRPGGGNLTSPLWIGQRLYFGSDHQGHGQLFSCLPDGHDLQQHTRHSDFYVRRPNSDGASVVYQCGAEIYHYLPDLQQSHPIPIRLRAAGFGRQRKFTAGGSYLESYTPHPRGKSLACTVRGKGLAFYTHERAVHPVGLPQGVRYRQLHWLPDGERLVCISDEGGEERLEIYHWRGEKERALQLDLGRPLKMSPCPNGPWLALTNHRYELWLVHLDESRAELVEKNLHDRMAGLAWSPCGRFLAYSSPTGRITARLRLLERDTLQVTDLTEGCFSDVAPHFDPKGRYLYFLSLREFNPVWDNFFFEMSFPNGMRPYLLTLRSDLLDPFEHDPDPPEESPARKRKTKKSTPEPTRIELDGIAGRILAFPVAEGRYGQVMGCGDTVWFSRFPSEGTLDVDPETPRGTLVSYEFKSQEAKDVYHKVSNFTVSNDGKWLCYRSGQKLRLVSTEKKPDSNEESPGRKSGWISGQRLRVPIEPKAEWRQMAREAWRLMREHFWDPQLGGHDWEAIYQRYLPLLDRVGCRSELSDWLWEMQGELGTSHAYESGGDYASEPNYGLGKLGLEWAWDSQHCGYRVERVLPGDSWSRNGAGPGRRPGLWLQPGDLVTHIQGQRLSAEQAPEAQLVNHSRQEVSLQLLRGKKDLHLSLKPLRQEVSLRYRHWVESNRRWVHQHSQGRLGYLHVPNMGPQGFAEFHRGYFGEVQRQGLIVDVRFNGGGNVSGLLLEKLSRRIVGWDVPRYGEPVSYPMDAPHGPLIALTNEMAGSDGDIFSHCFKLLKLGPLVGTRTWGGVIGIWPRHKLVDGSQTTQPEFAFWFEDVGWRVENYGTDPDITVDIAPQDWLAGRDPQLQKALELGLERLSRQPSRPEFNSKNS
ncbi:PDZ domain-containing protein [bacterium]|nr:PDZ domain-containing protein [bacterium]